MTAILIIIVMVLLTALLAWILASVMGGTSLEREASTEDLRLSFMTWILGASILGCVGIWLGTLGILLALT